MIQMGEFKRYAVKRLTLKYRSLRIFLFFVNFYNLFDLDFYNAQISKKYRFKTKAMTHFLYYGNRFGLDISPLVDSDWIYYQYLTHNMGKESRWHHSRTFCTLRYFSYGYRDGKTATIFNQKFIEKPSKNFFFIQTEVLISQRKVKILKKQSVDFSNYFKDYSNSRKQDIVNSYILVIPSFGNYHLLKICLRMIDPTIPNLRIVVINDGYPREIPYFFKAKYPNIEFVENEKNVGFLSVVNTVYDIAKSFNYLILINTDTFLENNFLLKIDNLLSSDKTIGILGLRSLSLDGTVLEHGGIVAKDGTGIWNHYGLDADLEVAQKNIQSQYVSANAMVIKTDILIKRKQIFDNRFIPAYYEDTDLCFYARENGFKVVASGQISCIHLVSQTYSNLNKESSRTNTFLMKKNKDIFQKKWKNQLIKDAAKMRDSTIWWIDDQYFFENRDAGNFRNYQLSKVLLDHDFRVFLISTKSTANYIEKQRSGLSKYNVDSFSSVDDAIGAAEQFSWLAPSLVIISRWDNYVRYEKILKTMFSGIKIVYDMVDRHGVRINLEEIMGLRDKDGLGDRISILERECAINADLTIFISNKEKNETLASNKAAVIPIPEELGNIELSKNYSHRKDILFFANFYHKPNIDGLKHFLETVWINFEKNDKISTLDIAGFGILNTIRDELLKYPNVKILGHIENLNDIISNYLCTLAPLRYGAGVKGKVIKSLAQFTPVIGSEYAFEGIDIDNYISWCVCTSKSDYIQKLEMLTLDKKLWQNISESGAALLKKEFDLNLIQQRFVGAIYDTIHRI